MSLQFTSYEMQWLKSLWRRLLVRLLENCDRDEASHEKQKPCGHRKNPGQQRNRTSLNYVSSGHSKYLDTPTRSYRHRSVSYHLGTPSISQRLPSEIVTNIVAFLPPSSILALWQTSRYSCNNAGYDSLEDVYKQARTSPGEWFSFWCSMERDPTWSKERYACRACQTQHPLNWFNSAELGKQRHGVL